MTRLYVLDVPENEGVVKVASTDGDRRRQGGTVLPDHCGRRHRDRPTGHRLPPRRLVQRRRRAGGIADHAARQGRPAGGAPMTTHRVAWARDAHLTAAEVPRRTPRSTAHELTTIDGAKVSGLLRTVPGATAVAFLMHPRQDFSHHVLVPEFLNRGFAVWTQGSRTMGNDLTLLHEQALLDMATGQVFVRDPGFETVISVGHSGGGALAAYYIEQAAKAPEDRVVDTPGGKPIPLAKAEMPFRTSWCSWRHIRARAS